MNDFFSDSELQTAGRMRGQEQVRPPVIVDATMQRNIDAFCTQLDGLLPSHLGEYVIFANSHLFKVCNTLESALSAAYAKFGTAPFLVQRVEPLRTQIDFHATCRV